MKSSGCYLQAGSKGIGAYACNDTYVQDVLILDRTDHSIRKPIEFQHYHNYSFSQIQS